jgi:alkylhydroperoxidase family enzyme
MADLNVFRILLHNPSAAVALNGLLHRLLWRGTLDARLRELVILRIGWVSGAVYEWTQHWHVSLALGLDEADLVAVRDWEAHPGFGPVERAVLAATDETLADGVIGDATWAACAEHLDEAVLVELVAVIGNWGLFARLLRSLDVPLDDGMDPWPPDGRGPEGATP